MVRLKYGFTTSLVLIVMAVPASVLRGYVIATAWAWFVVPLGSPPLGWAHAYGLSVLAQFATLTLQPVKDSDVVDAVRSDERKATQKEKGAYLISHGLRLFLFPLVALLLAWLGHKAMGL